MYLTIIILIFSILLFIVGIISNYDYYKIKQYPILKNVGTILFSHIENIDTKYKLVIQYEYTINNVQYTNNQITKYNIIYDTIDDAKNELDKYRTAVNLNIIYNPLNLNESYLDHNKHNNIYYITSIIMGIIPIILIIDSLNNCTNN